MKIRNKEALSEDEKILGSLYNEAEEALWHMRGLKEAAQISCDAAATFRRRAGFELSDLALELGQAEPEKPTLMRSLGYKLADKHTGTCYTRIVRRIDFQFNPEDLEDATNWLDAEAAKYEAIRKACN
jgi:hypothetical protein